MSQQTSKDRYYALLSQSLAQLNASVQTTAGNYAVMSEHFGAMRAFTINQASQFMAAHRLAFIDYQHQDEGQDGPADDDAGDLAKPA